MDIKGLAKRVFGWFVKKKVEEAIKKGAGRTQ